MKLCLDERLRKGVKTLKDITKALELFDFDSLFFHSSMAVYWILTKEHPFHVYEVDNGLKSIGNW